MLIFKSGKVGSKEKKVIEDIIQETLDVYSDFYITRSNLRLFIKDNSHILYDYLEKGDKIVYSMKDGIIFVTGFSDNSKRIYIKPLIKDAEAGDRLLKVLLWHVGCDLFAKIKKNHPFRKVLLHNNFKFVGDRGKEILLCRKYIKEEKDKEEYCDFRNPS